MSRTTSRCAAVAAVAALLLAGCTSDGPEDAAPSPSPTAASSSAPVVAAPPPATPAVDACYRLSYEEAVAPSTADPGVTCERPHTSQTYAVGALDQVVQGHLLAVDSERVRAQVAQKCPKRLAAYVGATEGELRLSMLRPVWFTPTLEEADLGASWYRCDVIAVTGEDSLAKIPGDLKGALKRPAERSAFGMCGTAEPGAPEFAHVLCREDHTWKAISVVDLADLAPAGGGYPGEQVVRDAEGGQCADAALEIASDALDYEWGYEWPTQDQWRTGQTYGRCWSPDPA